MAELFASGRVIELILALILVEAVILCALVVFWHKELPTLGLLLNLFAGACLLLALRSVLIHQHWTVAATWLALAFVAHVADLFIRLRRDSTRQLRKR